ncbi:hypothetical protein ARMGADRAFT_1033531 [Armillaria gallica]|uniref:Uncharacterized protein n=1 Tax=Armillaria gallica TaxID=47427 RepID=A0A2H3DDH6_ARMGA|nr:hypothetical protein ARMGADRAFT_1033531 [Armillaria gallica]
MSNEDEQLWWDLLSFEAQSQHNQCANWAKVVQGFKRKNNRHPCKLQCERGKKHFSFKYHLIAAFCISPITILHGVDACSPLFDSLVVIFGTAAGAFQTEPALKTVLESFCERLVGLELEEKDAYTLVKMVVHLKVLTRFSQITAVINLAGESAGESTQGQTESSNNDTPLDFNHEPPAQPLSPETPSSSKTLIQPSDPTMLHCSNCECLPPHLFPKSYHETSVSSKHKSVLKKKAN